MRRYDWLTTGEKSGELVVEQADKALSYSFSFNDRGRGPELVARYRLDEKGVPTNIELSGKNYEKGDATERFSLSGSIAKWTRAGTVVERSVRMPTLYALQGLVPPEHTAILARALLLEPARQMPLAQGGNLRIEPLTTERFDGAGRAVNATLYALYAASPYPDYIWLDEAKNLFGADYGWFAVAREGYVRHALPRERDRAPPHQDRASLDQRPEPAPAKAGVERMNRTIEEATVKRYHYDSHARLTAHLHDFIDAYNYGRRLKTPRGLTPYEYICKCRTSEPQRFTSDPHHQMPGPNN